MTEPILCVILEGSMYVIMKCNTELPGKAYWYIIVILLVYLVENANLFWKYATLRWERVTLITGKRSGGAKLRLRNNLYVENRR